LSSFLADSLLQWKCQSFRSRQERWSDSAAVSADPYKHDGFQHIHAEMQEKVGALFFGFPIFVKDNFVLPVQFSQQICSFAIGLPGEDRGVLIPRTCYSG